VSVCGYYVTLVRQGNTHVYSKPPNAAYLSESCDIPYSVRGLERSELGRSHGYPRPGAFGTDFYDRSTRTIVGTMVWTEYRPVINIGPKGALGSHEIRPIHSAPSLGQSIDIEWYYDSLFFSPEV